MIIWRGWGLLAAVIMGATILAVIAVHDGLKIRSIWVAIVIILAGGVINWFVGRALNRPHEQAGKKLWQRHCLFFVPMEWWSAAFVLFAFYMLSVR